MIFGLSNLIAKSRNYVPIPAQTGQSDELGDTDLVHTSYKNFSYRNCSQIRISADKNTDTGLFPREILALGHILSSIRHSYLTIGERAWLHTSSANLNVRISDLDLSILKIECLTPKKPYSCMRAISVSASAQY